MILRESIVVSFLGGLFGIGLGWLLIYSTSAALSAFGTTVENIRPALITQAMIVTAIIGIFGGVYPAWNASRLPPIEALRYEGGSGGKIRRLPFGGMALQSLWQRITRTMLTVLAIALTIGGIMALEGFMGGFTDMFNASMASDAEIMIRQADIADTSLSAIDERVGDKIAAMPEVQSVSGLIFSAVVLPESGSFMLIEGLAPNEYGIRRFTIIEGKPLSGNRQIILGKQAADAMHTGVGETIELQGSRFRVVGLYETGTGWEDSGGVISLRDGQNLVGRSRKVTMFSVKLHDPAQAEMIVENINATYPEAYATLAGDFVDQMPDMEASDAMIWAISFLAILVGGLGVMNTMLMAVLERTREIGVLRALGWRRRAVMGMILKESILLSIIGAAAGVLVAFGLAALLNIAMGSMMQGADFQAVWTLEIFMRSIILALLLGSLGGLYPAFRATRLQPIEALRYE